jgi:hypothetical protein
MKVQQLETLANIACQRSPTREGVRIARAEGFTIYTVAPLARSARRGVSHAVVI